MVGVIVKTLRGELLSLDVDETLGLNGVRDQLSAEDPVAYPSDRTDVVHCLEHADALQEGDVLMAVVRPQPMCRVTRVYVINVPNSNKTYYHPVDVWEFVTATGTPIFLYRTYSENYTYTLSQLPTENSRYTDQYVFYAVADERLSVEILRKTAFCHTLLPTLFYHRLLRDDSGMTIYDQYVIQCVVARREKEIDPHCAKQLLYPKQGFLARAFEFCLCGRVVEQVHTLTHRASTEHQVHHLENLEFMERARGYAEESYFSSLLAE